MPESDGSLRSLPFFTGFGVEAIKRMEKAMISHSVGRGEFLFLDGEPCQGLYIVESGQIKIFKNSSEGREQVLDIVGPGAVFNEIPIFDGGANPASALAQEDSTVYIIPKETISSILPQCLETINIIRLFADRTRNLITLVADLSFLNVIGRLAKMLLDLAVVEQALMPAHRLTQDEMAARIGTVRDVLSRELRNLEKKGAIKIEGRRILIKDTDKLRSMF
jgi:CRP/FNR family transcriptional regulator